MLDLAISYMQLSGSRLLISYSLAELYKSLGHFSQKCTLSYTGLYVVKKHCCHDGTVLLYNTNRHLLILARLPHNV